MARMLGECLFWLGIIIAVGYAIAVGYVATGLSDAWGVADTVLVFAVPTITVAVGWAPRYVLGGHSIVTTGRVPTLEKAKAQFKSSWSSVREANNKEERQP
jgi:hypothetical protein